MSSGRLKSSCPFQTEEDINDLFTDVGPVKSFSLAEGGKATVVFVKKADAKEAISRYNGVPLDGREMSLELVGTNVATYSKPAVLSRLSVRGEPRQERRERREPRGERDDGDDQGMFRGGRGGRGRGGRGRGARGGRGRRGDDMRQPVNEKALEDDLDSYFNS